MPTFLAMVPFPSFFLLSLFRALSSSFIDEASKLILSSVLSIFVAIPPGGASFRLLQRGIYLKAYNHDMTAINEKIIHGMIKNETKKQATRDTFVSLDNILYRRRYSKYEGRNIQEYTHYRSDHILWRL